ncbi:MAG: hypothetical protein R3B96_14860 [Pirellulaceae bacterium]
MSLLSLTQFRVNRVRRVVWIDGGWGRVGREWPLGRSSFGFFFSLRRFDA